MSYIPLDNKRSNNTEHNDFFKQTKFTLDDMHVYAGPLVIAKAAYNLSVGLITEEEFDAVKQQAVIDFKVIHAEMDAAHS